MMHRKWWAALMIPLTSAGILIGKLHLVSTGPEVFFALGVAATLCVVGAIYYGLDAIRGARAGTPYGN